METKLSPQYAASAQGLEAEAILRSCVHCGFCTATCPTYQLLGDEQDGPRGRIYLIKQVLEGDVPTRSTQEHLDRCLTCRNCESTCPSGVQYGRLIDIGRELVDQQVKRPLGERIKRRALTGLMSTRAVFEPAMALGQAMRPLAQALLPATLADKIPMARPAGVLPTRKHARQVILLRGCVQPAMLPSIDAATQRVLDKLGVQAIIVQESGCCGAMHHHMSDHQAALQRARRNIDAWWPLIADSENCSVEAIVMNASGCGVMVKDYAHLLRDDSQYAEKARRVVELTKDLSEYLPSMTEQLLALPASGRAAQRAVFHPPCTLQHGQQLRGSVETLLKAFGATVLPVRDAHLCCGSAGTYSVLQPELSHQLRDNKLSNLQESKPDVILSANIGCITHLQTGTSAAVLHWVEWLDQELNQL